MNLNDMYYFAEIIKNNGFTATERALGIPKSKLSRRLTELERSLGLRLIHRNTRRLQLTTAGQEYYARCRAMVEQAEAAEATAKQLRAEPSGVVRISCPHVIANYQLPDILALFLKDYPKVEVRLTATDTPATILLEERIDVAIVIPDIVEPGGSDLVMRKLLESSPVLAAGPGYAARAGLPKRLEDIPDHQTVGSAGDKMEGPVTWTLFGPDRREARVSHQPRFRTQDIMSQLNVTIAGFGLALVAEVAAARYFNTGELVRVLPEWRAAPSPLVAAFKSRQGFLPAVRAFLDYLTKYVPIFSERYLRVESAAGEKVGPEPTTGSGP